MTLRIHPDNPKILQFRGEQRVLLCATEHYGAVINRAFRYERYLEDAAEKGQTLSRLFTLFRELQTALNLCSTCKPETPDFVTPFKRTGPGTALDGEPRFDLSRWNDEYFDRLHGFLGRASEYGILVEVVLFSNTYAEDIWSLNPLHPANNINLDEKPIRWQDYLSGRHAELLHWQQAHARRIVEQTRHYDNVIYDICNEPGAFRSGDLPSADEVNAWQSGMIELVRSTAEDKLLAGQQAFLYDPEFEHPSDAAFGELDFDIVNIHPLPNICFDGRAYDMGGFMSKRLQLTAIRDFALATYACTKPLNYDEDNVATRYLDPEGWTIQRKRAWTSLMCGAHYDMIDFSILPHHETGTAASRRCVRSWIGHLSRFIHSVDLVRARPLTGWLQTQPDNTVASVLAVAGEEYNIYLADGREREEAGCGQPIAGRLGCTLPERDFAVSAFSPESGAWSPALQIGGGATEFELPVFTHDILIRIGKFRGA